MAVPHIRRNLPVVFENQEPRSVSMNAFNDGLPSTGGLSFQTPPSSAGGGMGSEHSIEEDQRERVINPFSGRLIYKNGKLYKELLKRLDDKYL